MAYPASDTCRCFGRTAAYAVYNLGVGILVGFARTIVSTYYLAKQFFYKETYNRNASQLLGRGVVRRFADASLVSIQDAKSKLWKGELVRGLVEMIPLIGTAYFTYKDNQTKHNFIREDTYKASTYGIKELGELINKEYRSDQLIREVLGNDIYNPIDLRFQDWIRS